MRVKSEHAHQSRGVVQIPAIGADVGAARRLGEDGVVGLVPIVFDLARVRIEERLVVEDARRQFVELCRMEGVSVEIGVAAREELAVQAERSEVGMCWLTEPRETEHFRH